MGLLTQNTRRGAKGVEETSSAPMGVDQNRCLTLGLIIWWPYQHAGQHSIQKADGVANMHSFVLHHNWQTVGNMAPTPTDPQ
jgi:hypothetical protein